MMTSRHQVYPPVFPAGKFIQIPDRMVLPHVLRSETPPVQLFQIFPRVSKVFPKKKQQPF